MSQLDVLSSSPCLRWVSPQGEEREYTLSAEETVFGRGSQSDITLLDPFVSRRHAKIIRVEEEYFIADLDSTHGTLVNGEKIRRKRLRDGDRIRLGHVRLLFLERPGESDLSDAFELTGKNLQKTLSELASAVSLPVDSETAALEKVNHILDFQCQWGQSFSSKIAFGQILLSALRISGAERGYILVSTGGSLGYALGLDLDERVLPEKDFRASRTVIETVLRQGSPVLLTKEITGSLAQQDSVRDLELHSVACLPLRGISLQSRGAHTLGILYLDSTHAMNTLSRLERKILNKLAVEAGGVLEKLELLKSIDERERFARELETAQVIQRRLLPGSLPQLPEFKIGAVSEASREVGGDFYDFLPTRQGELIGVLADASGKGLPAALMSSLLQGALDMGCRIGVELRTLVEQVNRLLWERSDPHRFATLFCFCLATDGRGSYISAGHNPAYLLRHETGVVESLNSNGLILGAFDSASYRPGSLRMEPGDLMLVYSDGVTEAESPRGDFFGEERLRAILQRDRGCEVSALKEGILRAVEEFTEGTPQTDDMTLLLVQYCGTG